ncbi:hypothetical protein BT96DRAFT_948349 [Gymnopus androsaceus JB14]|uniref:Uncharacterized protein n=1 Tax=Gymnopus androsaceus JB14 TaxID=1447944 RepID=A0A6A4GQB7_9AGAR|nr:hypothetical protein BT96DRAFT_948349 [Gymnopus androsaceus JB14]
MPSYTNEERYQDGRYDLMGDEERKFIEEGGAGWVLDTEGDVLLILRIRAEVHQKMKKRQALCEYYQRKKERFDALPEDKKEIIRENHRWAQRSYHEWKRAELAKKLREARLQKKAQSKEHLKEGQ